MVLQKRNWVTIAVVTVLMLTLAMALSTWQKPLSVQAAEEASDKKTISVQGSGEIIVEPDVAYLNLGVLSKAKTAEEAQSANAAAFEKINQVLAKDFKLTDKDIKTVGFNVHPEYSYHEEKERTITGYAATHSIQVTYRDLERIGELLDAVSKAGANQVNGVNFAVEDTSSIELEAMKKAMKNAREKAEVLAAAEGQTVKEVIQITNNSYTSGPIYSNGGGYMMDMAAKESASTSINTGEVTVTAQVSVTYEF